MSTKGRRRSSLIRYKEKGGCTVQQLAGTSGLDYHGPCKSIKTPGNFHFNVFKLIGKICGKTDYLLCVKASIIFVYDSKNLNSPMYSVNLASKTCSVRGKRVELYTNLLLDTAFKFSTLQEVEDFHVIVIRGIEVANTDEVKKKLKHPLVLDKRASTVFAKKISESTEKAAPKAEQGIKTEGMMYQNMGGASGLGGLQGY